MSSCVLRVFRRYVDIPDLFIRCGGTMRLLLLRQRFCVRACCYAILRCGADDTRPSRAAGLQRLDCGRGCASVYAAFFLRPAGFAAMVFSCCCYSFDIPDYSGA